MTKAHREQLTINQNVSRDIAEIGNAANLGGYNLVRFAFEKRGIYYRLSSDYINNPIGMGGDVGDYYEISSHTEEDIPAYGYLTSDNRIKIDFKGDFMSQYSQLAVRNVTKGLEMYDSVNYESFEGTSLEDYNPNECKKQLFNVIDDLAYGTGTQYASFDLNKDGIYNFVFIGVLKPGKDGRSILSTNGVDVEEIVQQMKLDDLILFAENNDTSFVNPEAVIGDVYRYNGNNNFEYVGNIRGERGLQGEKGEQGDQGIQGVQGEQGDQGIQGEKGDKGDPGASIIRIFSGVLNSPSELPDFNSASIGDAYRIINTYGSVVTYDLYFKSSDGTTWDIQPNWGGVPGPKGDKGDKGDAGIQGIQGEQGPIGPAGPKGDTGPEGPRGPAGPKGDSGADTTKFYIIEFQISVKDPNNDDFFAKTIKSYAYIGFSYREAIYENAGESIRDYCWRIIKTVFQHGNIPVFVINNELNNSIFKRWILKAYLIANAYNPSGKYVLQNTENENTEEINIYSITFDSPPTIK